MSFAARIWLVGTLACAMATLSAPVAQAEFGVKTFEAGTCKTDAPECTYTSPEAQFYTQAAGHPPLGITGFEVNTTPAGEPEGNIKDVRVDIPPGLAVNPEATEQCTKAQFESATCPLGSQVGVDEITAFIGVLPLGPVSLPMYNIVQPEGVPAEFGFALKVPPLVDIHVYIVGGISWYHEGETSENSKVPTGDYHEFFTIKEIPTTISLVKSRLKFTGTAGNGTFLTLPSLCGTQASYLHADSYQSPGQFKGYQTVSGEPPQAVRVSGCKEVPFSPEVAVKPAQSGSDQPDGATVEVKVPQSSNAAEINSSALRDARVVLPEGMTLNPSVANFIEACTDAQFGKGTANPIACPPSSQIGTATIETPDLPAKSLVGAVYVGQPSSTDPQSGNEYRIFIDAAAPRYGVSVRLEGKVSANPSTGRLTTTVLENPQVPFSDFILDLAAGPRTPLANPLVCGPATTGTSLAPYSGNPPAEPFMAFPIDFDGRGGSCPSPLPFTLSQSATSVPTTGAANTNFTYSLARADGQQYLSKVATTLPPGLVGKIPTVPLCGEPQAAAGQCAPSSQIGTTSVSVGSGPTPLTLAGLVYLTGPYAGAPYGLSVVVPAEKVGPFNYGRIVTRAAITVDPYTARITVSSQLPTIVGGVPLRLKGLTVNVNRPNFTVNPSNCGALDTTTALTSTFGTTQSLSTPFKSTGCDALAFTPKLTASTNAKTSRANGAILVVKVGYPSGPQANIKSVVVSLPKQLPSRLSTLNHACPQAIFAANPAACPAKSSVGTATVTTPVLPGKLTGPAMFVSHGGAAFPDLDFVLKGDGVTVILIGNTNITHAITTSSFAAVPDVPVSSFEVRLPTGRNSVLTAVGSVCKKSLVMPTTITAQNGKTIKQRTKIAVGGCPLRIVSERVRGHKAFIVVKAPAPGTIVGSGRNLIAVAKHPRKAQNVKLVLGLSRSGLGALARHHRLTLHARVRFAPRKGRKVAASLLKPVAVKLVFR